MNIERLKKMAQLGDADAAGKLLTAVSRKDDVASCMEAFQILFEAGLWEDVLRWMDSRIKIHTNTKDTAWLCNHLKRIFVLNRQIKCPECGGSGIYKNRNGQYFGYNGGLLCGKCNEFAEQIDFSGEPLPEIDPSKLPPAEDVLDLWGKSIKAWWPEGWMDWLTGHDGWVKGMGRIWFGYGAFFIDRNGNADTNGGLTYPDLPDVPNCICDTNNDVQTDKDGLCRRCQKKR